MGQKINPIGLRVGINRTWDSRWFAGKNEYGNLLHEDIEIRKELMKQLKQAAVSRIVIERPHKKCRVTIHSASSSTSSKSASRSSTRSWSRSRSRSSSSAASRSVAR